MRPVRVRGIGRTARLLSIPAGTAAYAVAGRARRLTGADPEVVRREMRSRNAARTRRVLGDMRGGALKAGQLLSTLEALFPPDPEQTWREALTALQESNPPLPFAEVEPVLCANLGPDWREGFGEFDETAFAAASIGQVHRATSVDGRRLAVKVQYPGVAAALATDMRAVAVATRLAALVARGLAMPPLVAEMRTRLAEELDYVHEGSAQRRFATAYAGDAEVAVPAVVKAAPQVLVQEFLDGTPLAQVAATGTQPERNRAGLAYMRFLLSGPARAGLLHTDPHPGNFALLPDGRLGVLDFGSTLELPDGMPSTFGRLLRVLRVGNEAAVLAGLTAEGFVRPGARVDARALVDYLSPFTEPSRHEVFSFSRAWLREQFGRVNDPRNPDFGVALQLSMPPEHLFTHRVWLGCVGVLCQLEATIPVRSEVERLLPGLAEPS